MPPNLSVAFHIYMLSIYSTPQWERTHYFQMKLFYLQPYLSVIMFVCWLVLNWIPISLSFQLTLIVKCFITFPLNCSLNIWRQLIHPKIINYFLDRLQFFNVSSKLCFSEWNSTDLIWGTYINVNKKGVGNHFCYHIIFFSFLFLHPIIIWESL